MLSAPIRSLTFCAIDFESAGATRGGTDVPVQIGLARWSPAAGFGDTFVSYLATDRPIAWSARKVHGISRDDLAGAPTLLSLWPELSNRLSGTVLVAHGHGTEKRFLRTFPAHPFGPWVDTLTLARTAWPGLPDHSLGALCDQLGLSAAVERSCPGRRWHDALFDAVASLHLLAHLVESLALEGQPLGHLRPR